MTTQQAGRDGGRAGRRVGYVIAAFVNLVGLVIVNNLLGWGLLDFLTDEFERIVPLFTFSLAVSIAANLVYLVKDQQPLRSAGQIGLNLIGLFVTYQLYQVFPFDFGAYAFNWEGATRIVLILAMVGCGVGVVAEALKLAFGRSSRERKVLDAHGT